MIATTLAFLGQLLTLVVFAWTCFVLGKAVLRRLQFVSRAEEACVCTTVGMGLLAVILFLLGMAHLLYASVIVVATVCVHLWGHRVWRETYAGLVEWWRSSRRAPIALIGLAAAMTPSFILTLYPPSSYDETMYHLPFAKLFAHEHAVVFAETLRFPVFPQLSEILFTALLILRNDVSTHLVQFLAAALTAMAIFCAMGGKRSPAATWGAALWLGNPIVIFFAGTSYIDLVLALFCTVAWLCWTRWRDTLNTLWLIPSATCAGFAAGTKYLGLYFLAVFILMTGWTVIRRRQKPMQVILFIAVALLALSPWYVRNAVVTGNPVFPYLGNVFGRSDWPTLLEGVALRAQRMGDSQLGAVVRHLVGSPEAVITLPWRLVAERETFGGPPYSPFLMALTPLVIIAALVERKTFLLFLCVLAYVVLLSRRDIRYLLPAAALFCVIGGTVMQRIIDFRHPRASPAIMALVAMILVSPGFAYGMVKVKNFGAFPVSSEQRHSFLAREVPVYRAIRFMNQLRGDRYVLYAVHHPEGAYFAEGRFLGDVMGPARYSRVINKAHDAADLHVRLRTLKATHFLVDRSVYTMPPKNTGTPPPFRRLMEYDGLVLYELRP